MPPPGLARQPSVDASAPSAIAERVAAINWTYVGAQLGSYGCATTGSLLTGEECAALAGMYGSDAVFRSRIVMSRHGFGRGEYKYFAYPLPNMIRALREELYSPLADIADRWNEELGSAALYPHDHAAYLMGCHQAGQTKPTPLLLQYGTGDYNCLHQDLYGEHRYGSRSCFRVLTLISRAESSYSLSNARACSRVPRLYRLGKVKA